VPLTGAWNRMPASESLSLTVLGSTVMPTKLPPSNPPNTGRLNELPPCPAPRLEPLPGVDL
jgi:hypothetical protein